MTDFKLNFQDTETAFADKSDSELKEKYRMFQNDEFTAFEQYRDKSGPICAEFNRFTGRMVDKKYDLQTVLRRRNNRRMSANN